MVRSLLNGALLKFEGVKTLLSAECLPLINTLVVLLAAIMIYVLYNQAKYAFLYFIKVLHCIGTSITNIRKLTSCRSGPQTCGP